MCDKIFKLLIPCFCKQNFDCLINKFYSNLYSSELLDDHASVVTEASIRLTSMTQFQYICPNINSSSTETISNLAFSYYCPSWKNWCSLCLSWKITSDCVQSWNRWICINRFVVIQVIQKIQSKINTEKVAMSWLRYWNVRWIDAFQALLINDV